MVGGDKKLVSKVLSRLLTTDAEAWMFNTTVNNLELILSKQTNEEFQKFMHDCLTKIKKMAVN
jgi:hypothetical protein